MHRVLRERNEALTKAPAVPGVQEGADVQPINYRGKNRPRMLRLGAVVRVSRDQDTCENVYHRNQPLEQDGEGMSKITLEDCANELYGLEVGLPSNVLCERGAALIRAAQKLVDVVGTPIQYLPILDGNEFLSCVVCGDDWLRGEPEQHMPECALVAFRKEEEGE